MPGQLLLLLGENLTGLLASGTACAQSITCSPGPRWIRTRSAAPGHSGGGTLTLFISALDERVRCAVVNEGGTSHRWPVSLEPGAPVGPSDVEQNLFPSALYGIDRCDLHVAIAPRPLLALTEEFTPRFNLAADHIRERYRQLGVPEKFATEEATDPHAYTLKLRQATTRWFCRWFYDRQGPRSEPEFEAEPPRNLYCTPNGSVRYAHQGDTIFSLILKKQAPLPPPPRRPSTRAEWEAWRRRFPARGYGCDYATSPLDDRLPCARSSPPRGKATASRRSSSFPNRASISQPGSSCRRDGMPMPAPFST